MELRVDLKFASIFFLLLLISCTNTDSITDPDDIIPKENRQTNSSLASDSIIYYLNEKDTVFNLPYSKAEYTVSGHFKDYLKLSSDGTIDVKNSTPGIFYPITITNRTDVKQVYFIISGICYNEVLVCDTTVSTLSYSYNGKAVSVHEGSKFDTPPPGVATVSSQGLFIDQNTGNIDLKRSVEEGVLGPSPQNGELKDFRIYFKLNDQSNFALNYADITLIYATSDSKSSARISDNGSRVTLERCTTRVIVCK